MTLDAKSDAPRRPALRPIVERLVVELGPLLVFFGVYKAFGLMAATAAFMAAVLAATAVSYLVRRRLPILPAIATVVVLITGGLTLVFDDEQFIKMRPTIVNGFYGIVVIGSMLAGRPMLRAVMRGTLDLTPEGWRGLTWRLGAFLLLLAVANEIIWRTMSTDTWVNFKVFGLVPLDILFGLSMWPYVKRHWNPTRGGKAQPRPGECPNRKSGRGTA